MPSRGVNSDERARTSHITLLMAGDFRDPAKERWQSACRVLDPAPAFFGGVTRADRASPAVEPRPESAFRAAPWIRVLLSPHPGKRVTGLL